MPSEAYAHTPGGMEFLLGPAIVGGFATLFLDILRISKKEMDIFYFCLFCLYSLKENHTSGG